MKPPVCIDNCGELDAICGRPGKFGRCEGGKSAGYLCWKACHKAFRRIYPSAIDPDAELIRTETEKFAAAAEHAVGKGDAVFRENQVGNFFQRALFHNQHRKTAAVFPQPVSGIDQRREENRQAPVIEH